MIRWPVLCVVSLLLVTGTIACSSSRSPHRGSLSDAMKEAADDDDDDDTYPKAGTKSSEPSHEVDTDDGDDVGLVAGLLASGEGDSESGELEKMSLGFSGSFGTLKGDDYYGLKQARVSVGGFMSPRTAVELRGSVNHVPLQQTSNLNHSLDGGIVMWQLGGAAKFFTTPQHTFMGQYFLVGVNWTYMNWTYENPITVEDETIESDWLHGFDMYVGLGWNLIQTNPLRLGLEATPGLILWTNRTSEGFDNDVFDTFYYVRFGVTAQFGL